MRDEVEWRKGHFDDILIQGLLFLSEACGVHYKDEE